MISKPLPLKPRPRGGLQFRLYFLHRDGHFEKVHEFEAKDDEAAIRISEGWREDRRMELWERSRLVKVWS